MLYQLSYARIYTAHCSTASLNLTSNGEAIKRFRGRDSLGGLKVGQVVLPAKPGGSPTATIYRRW